MKRLQSLQSLTIVAAAALMLLPAQWSSAQTRSGRSGGSLSGGASSRIGSLQATGRSTGSGSSRFGRNQRSAAYRAASRSLRRRRKPLAPRTQIFLGMSHTVDLLDERKVKRLSPEGRKAYEKVVDLFDHINYEGALEVLETEAIPADPKDIDLLFMAVNAASYLGQRTFAPESNRFFEIGLRHARELTELTVQGSRTRLRADQMLSDMTDKVAKVDQRDEARRTYGMQLAKEYAREVYSRGGDADAVSAAKKSARGLASSSQSGAAAATAAQTLAEPTVDGAPTTTPYFSSLPFTGD